MTTVIYGADWCFWCKEAKKVAEKYNITYEYKDIENPETYAELFDKVGEISGIPKIFMHDKLIGGYNDFLSEIENTMGNYGHGKI